MAKRKAKPTATTQDPFDTIPADQRERFLEVVAVIDQFCDRHLNAEYAKAGHRMAAYLFQPGSPAMKGKPEGWAAGVLYAVGKVNFLSDPSQTPHLPLEEIAKGVGVSPATMHNKGRTLWEGLSLMQFDPEFTVESNLDRNPLIWILEVNGFPMDIRDLPREAQVVAFEKGLIPYIPADRPAGTEKGED